MPKSFYSFESVNHNHPEVNYVQNLIDVENVSLDVEDEIPAHELQIMEAQFEEFWMEREAV